MGNIFIDLFGFILELLSILFKNEIFRVVLFLFVFVPIFLAAVSSKKQR